MSEAKTIPLLRHGARLLLVALVIGGLALLWLFGPRLLQGTILEELSIVLYVAAAFGLLTLAERIVSRFTPH